MFYCFLQSPCSRKDQQARLNFGRGRCLFEAKVIVLLKVFIKIGFSVMNHRFDEIVRCCCVCICFPSNCVASLFLLLSWRRLLCLMNSLFSQHFFKNLLMWWSLHTCRAMLFLYRSTMFLQSFSSGASSLQSYTKKRLGTFYWFLQCVRHLFCLKG